MAVQKTHASKVLMLLLCLVLIFSFPLTVSAAVGNGSYWDGLVSLDMPRADMNLQYSHTVKYSDQNGIVQPQSVNCVYQGFTNGIINIDMYETDVYLNGYLKKRLKFKTSREDINSETYYLNVGTNPIVMDNIFVSSQIVERLVDGSTTIDLYIHFDNYYVDSAQLNLPIYFDCTLAVWFDTSYWPDVWGYVGCDVTSVSDWHGSMMQYEKLEDVPSVDGYLSQQNQTIIDQSQTQIQNQQIQNQLQEQQNQLQNQGNQLQQESNAQNKNFMDNFFSNLGNTVLGWIVPSSEDLTAFLDNVNSWFSDRLGFVWYPFDLAYQLVSAFTQGEPNSMFKVPGFTLNFQGQQLQIWQPLEVDIDAFDIFKYVRYFTSALLACGVAHLAINKWDEWIGGHNS